MGRTSQLDETATAKLTAKSGILANIAKPTTCIKNIYETQQVDLVVLQKTRRCAAMG